MGLPGREKSLTIISADWVQYTNVTDERTDGRTRCYSKDRASRRRAGRRQFCVCLPIAVTALGIADPRMTFIYTTSGLLLFFGQTQDRHHSKYSGEAS